MTDVDARVVVVVVIIVVVLRTVLVLLVAAVTGFIFAAVKVLRASLVDNVIVIIETSGVVLVVVDNGVGDLPKADKRPFSLFVVGMLAVVAAIAAGLAAVVGLGSAAAVLPARYFAALAACSKRNSF